MRCIDIASPGGPEQLRLVERPDPSPSSGEVCIAVKAAGVNRPDILQRYGKYPPPPGASDVPGLEVSGVIAEVGPHVTRWRVGDAVSALVAGGGYAERCLAPEGQCLPVPDGCAWHEAAALPETTFTVWANVFERGRLTADEWLLVHGGTSGIGTTAIQLATALGARVVATAGSDDKCTACVSLGAVAAWNYRSTAWGRALLQLTEGRGVDLVLDMVGGDYTPRNLAVLADEGRLVQIAFLKSPLTELDWFTVMRKRLWLTGSTLRARSVGDKAALARRVEQQVWPLVAAGRVRPVIAARFPLAHAAEAHRLMESSRHIGKIVLDVGA
jgi:putative PIG3 family NAD(P)H quinone oxidoreductase